jgi:hypothetical protein
MTSAVSLVSANERRRARAARRDITIACRVLRYARRSGWPAGWPQHWRAVAETRVAMPGASWADLAAELGLTKDQAVTRFRYLREAFLALEVA